MNDLELAAALVDLGAHLDPGADVVAPVADRLRERPARRRVPPWLLAAAAIIVLATAVVLAVAPAREAVARWLGIGAVELRVDRPSGTAPVAPTAPAGDVDVLALERELGFDVRLLDPAPAGPPLGAEIDRTAPVPVVVVRYADVTLVQIPTQPEVGPVMGKVLGGSDVTSTDVDGAPAFWISGDPHEVAYLAPDGSVAIDTVRRAGDVLLWVEGAVTYRIEGAASLDDARELAQSLR